MKNMNVKNELLIFKTNINCSGCVAQVTPAMEAADGIQHWEVDTANPNKVLSVQSNGITEDEIVKTVQRAGFKIERIK
jgi:copper chaperone